MSNFEYKASQFLPISLGEAWAFFSSPNNLARITPKEMNFKVLSIIDQEIHNHMLINYTVSPLFGVPLKWQTELLEVQKPNQFKDIQLKGPFKKWEHTHEFKQVEGGVMMYDEVHYQLPFGWLGELVHSLIVKKKVAGIFAYRKEVLGAYFRKEVKNDG